MKLRLKLMVAPALTTLMLILAVVAAIAGLSYYQLRSSASHQAALDLSESAASIQARLAAHHTRLYRTLAIIASMQPAEIDTLRASQKKEIAALAEEVSHLAARLATDAGAPAKRFAELAAAYHKSSDGAIDLATIDPNTGVAALQSAEADYKAVTTSLDEVVEQARTATHEEVASLQAWMQRAAVGCGLAGLLGAGVLMVFAWQAQRRVVDSISEAAAAAERVAAGDLHVNLQSTSHDEVGSLVRALSDMVGKLGGSLQTVQQAAQSIGIASSEIASGNQDLSSRTEHTAGNLQQTASSMEQLTGTVRQTADAARTANQLASSAAGAASRGGEVVSQVVANMDEISTASRKIGDIIGVIDGIAFQTNILALNAAVEAARAGEQGRGFAVVASEVRSLAQRSAQAAREIKSLIQASSERVESGTRLVHDAGSTMQEIVASVQRVSDVISEISAATGEQSGGIGQVNQAVAQLDQLTQQNAALVEESAAAAESLKDQARRLNEVVGQFRL